ncbi:hypothetical protein V0U79_01045 [Hyphobacterium sp. HN65]|uniref:Auto-transporter adhesin head GIN domain-containing protein n=1 Tax=Hyphobacterium lacteum TaxID=3116575 RepID=A0ABU7LM32_9PROT|nr:hypothetical protein [Hyphobacterium sp. HN65]MEE2524937.1 hypothetical protein [Hyphobacterium sp. HN65]
MKVILATSAALGALMVGGCADSASATVHMSGAGAYSSADGQHVYDQDGDVSLMGSDMSVSGRIGGALSLIGSDLDVDADIGEGMSLVGSDITFSGSVGGNTSIAGSDVEWAGTSGGSVEIAGSDIEWSGSADDGLAIAGSDVGIDGRIGEDVDIAGSDVELSQATNVGGDLSIAGSDLIIHGTIGGNADLVGNSIEMDGRIEGRLLAVAFSRSGWSWTTDNSHHRIRINGAVGEGSAVCARRVEIGPEADISGTLAVFAEDPPVFTDGATQADVNFEEIGDRDCDDLLEPYDR